MVELLFTRRRHPGSLLIRTVTWSAWSHVDVVHGDNVIGAVAPHGVELQPLAERLAKASQAAVMIVPSAMAKKVRDIANTQLGKPYDWLGAAGIGLHRNWQETDSWFCSEFAAWCFSTAGHPLIRQEFVHRVTPQHLWMLPYEARFIEKDA